MWAQRLFHVFYSVSLGLAFLYATLLVYGYKYDFSTNTLVQMGVVTIDSSVLQNAEVSFNGEEAKEVEFPYYDSQVLVGKHTVTIEKEGYRPWVQKITVDDTDITSIGDVILLPKDIKKYQSPLGTFSKCSVSVLHQEVFCIHEDSKTIQWIGASEKGLHVNTETVSMPIGQHIHWIEKGQVVIADESFTRFLFLANEPESPRILLKEMSNAQERVLWKQYLVELFENGDMIATDMLSNDVYVLGRDIEWMTVQNQALVYAWSDRIYARFDRTSTPEEVPSTWMFGKGDEKPGLEWNTVAELLETEGLQKENLISGGVFEYDFFMKDSLHELRRHSLDGKETMFITRFSSPISEIIPYRNSHYMFVRTENDVYLCPTERTESCLFLHTLNPQGSMLYIPIKNILITFSDNELFMIDLNFGRAKRVQVL